MVNSGPLSAILRCCPEILMSKAGCDCRAKEVLNIAIRKTARAAEKGWQQHLGW